MATVEKAPATPAEDLAELERTVADLINGVRDPEEMDRAAREMDEGRDEIRQRLGELNMAVELVHESREES